MQDRIEQPLVESLGQELPGLISVPRFGSVVTEYERPNSGLDPAMYAGRPLPPTKLCKVWRLTQKLALEADYGYDRRLNEG